MKLTSLAILTALVVPHVYASPVEDVLSPSGVPATSGLPFSTLSFDTTANPTSLSALSSLISSESTAVTPPTASALTSSDGGAIPSYVPNSPTASPTTVSPGTLTSFVSGSTTPTSTTSGARGSRDVRSGVVGGVVVGAVAIAVVALV